jgi:hypothetical protein
MNALLSHAMHAIRFAMHDAASPLFRPVLAALAAAGLIRLVRRDAAVFAAGIGVLAGWCALDAPALFAWPPSPLGRLPGACLLLLLAALAEGKYRPWMVRLGLAALLAWWLRGAPLHGEGLAQCVPVFFGLLLALFLAERLGQPGAGDSGWARTAAALALAGALWVAGAALHWAVAALAVAGAALVLVGLPEPSVMLARSLMVVSAACVLASDRGRFLPVDAAAAMPLAAWFLSPRLTRLGPAGASFLAAAACVALAWGAAGVWAQR